MSERITLWDCLRGRLGVRSLVGFNLLCLGPYYKRGFYCFPDLH